MNDQGDQAPIAIDTDKCTGCGGCIDLCPAIAIRMANNVAKINDELCKHCYSCTAICPVKAPRKVAH